jgi:membrane associated rhomboid family serine protease
MLILGDESHHHGKIPWVTGALVVTNVLVFLLQLALGEPFTHGFSLVPREITEFRDLTGKQRVKVTVHDVYYDHRGHPHTEKRDEIFYVNHYPGPFPIVLTLFTSMFLHGGVAHLVGNMWFLLVFGRNVECAVHHGLFLAFYVLCGVAGGLAHVATDPHSVIPCLGASGAISGLLGAYVAIHPLNKIRLWLGWLVGVVELPALVVIGVWFLLQYVSAFMLLDHPEYGDGVAHWAHLGGFVAGIAFIWGTIWYLKRRPTTTSEIEAQPADLAAAASASEMPGLRLPSGAARAGAAAAHPDPFATFLPPPTQVVVAEPPDRYGNGQ